MSEHKRGLVFIGLAGVILVVLAGALPSLFKTSYETISAVGEATKELPPLEEEETRASHVSTPEPLKGLYMTACVAATPSWRTSLKRLIETTELNAVVLDIKDSTGAISIPSEELQPSGSIGKGCKVSDMREFIEELHASDIYVIGRISVFQDPHYAALHPELAVKSASTGGVWKDHKGLSFVDVGAREYWDYVFDIAKLSYETGFDELNLDYIRYPSDGNMKDTFYTWTATTTVTAAYGTSTTASTVRAATKTEMLERFFSYIREEIDEEYPDPEARPVLSADLFGMTTTVENDMGIGQVLESALPYFDYIAPMVYPSHYPKTWHGFANPAEHPYEVIKIAMTRAVEREVSWNVSQGFASSTPSKMRPWLQDFDLGAIYGPDKIRAQIQATYDSGLTSWMLWSAANTYTQSALLPAENALVERQN